MPFVRLLPLADLPPGSLIQAEVNDKSYAVCNYEGTVYAIDGVCPHAHGPLGCGALNGRSITCPWHMWGFDCVTGQSDVSASMKLETFAVKVEEGDVFIDVPL